MKTRVIHWRVTAKPKKYTKIRKEFRKNNKQTYFSKKATQKKKIWYPLGTSLRDYLLLNIALIIHLDNQVAEDPSLVAEMSYNFFSLWHLFLFPQRNILRASSRISLILPSFFSSENEKTSSAFRGLFYVTESQVIFLFFSIFYEKLGRF